MTMRTNLFTRALRIGAAVALAATLLYQPATAEKDRNVRRQGLNLNALVFGVLEVNRVFCGINVLGEVCVDPTNSPVVGGGFWPKGTPNQYIFNSGLQIAGIIPSDAGFEWAGDTTGVYFMDPRGDQNAGDPVSLVYNSLDPDDAQNWPDQGIIRDTAIYSDILIGRQSASQQDLWVRIWDGNPTIAGARAHPMGILVEERGMGWNFPSGNEDIIYFVFDFYNITAEDRAVYNNLRPEIQDSIHDIAVDFVTGVEDRFGVDIPSGGYTIGDFYAAFFMDPDVGNAGANYSTAILPFQMAVAYKSDFVEATWQYPPNINGPPFAPHPGFIGVKYLKSPVDPVSGNEVGLTMFSNTLNQATGLPDPVGVIQMWRYISGNNNPAAGDNPCNVANFKARKLCFLYDQQADTRFFQASGGPSVVLEPGGYGTIVVAYVHAAPVSAPLVASGEIGGDFKPLTPYDGDSIFFGTCSDNPTAGSLDGDGCVRPLEQVAGWLSHNDDDGSQFIEQDEVVSVSRSLLDKALVAQAVFDNKFLLPFAPDPPTFYLVGGDNSVTVVWEQSPSETLGDPFYTIASDPVSPLYDPNFRQFDVEGYRIYRGRTVAQLELIVQYDYSGTFMTDAIGVFDYTGNCAPELGITTDCPTFPNDVPLVDDVIQIPAGGRVLLADGVTVLNTSADTAVTGGGSPFPALNDGGVPFAYVDRAVRNAFTYHYAVTAFDINSVNSGPSSLESAQITQSIVPRTTAANVIAPEGISWALLDRDGNELDPAAPLPTLDATSGTFSGPMPPSGALAPFAAELFAAGLVIEGQTATFQIDSLDLSYYHECVYYLTVTGPTGSNQVTIDPPCPLGEEQNAAAETDPIKVGLTADQAKADSIGLAGIPLAGEVQAQLTVGAVTFQSRDADWHPAVNGSFFNPTSPTVNDDGGSRWFDGDNETLADPTLGGTGFGQLTGVNAIFQPAPFSTSANALFRRNLQTIYHSFRAADVKVYWGSTPGTVDSIIDVTHNMPMPFNDGTVHKGGWGFREDIAASSTTQAAADGLLDEYDFGHGPCFTARPSWSSPNCASFPYLQAAVLGPTDVDADGASDGNGFGMTINGHFFLFQTDALPSSTVWTLRSYMGLVDHSTGSYEFTPKPTNAPVWGLRLVATVGAPATTSDTLEVDLTEVHTVPDPYYVTTSLEATANDKTLQFVNLPTQAIIRIYSLSGILVQIVEHNDPTGGGTAEWDLRNRNNQIVASGVYFYHIEAANGQEHTGRFTVVNFAQ